MKKKEPQTAPATPGGRLRAARLRLGLTQARAAGLASVHVQDWSAYERGKAATLDRWHQLATAIGADPHEIDERLASTSEV